MFTVYLPIIYETYFFLAHSYFVDNAYACILFLCSIQGCYAADSCIIGWPYEKNVSFIKKNN